MHDADMEEWRIDNLLHAMNIHLPDVPRDATDTYEASMSPTLKDQALHELIGELSVARLRAEAAT